MVSEHLDHLHYLNDILRLQIRELNVVLSDHLLNRLFVPLLVYSLNHDARQVSTQSRDCSPSVAIATTCQ